MNAFSAAAILSQISLHDFLALRADQRLELVLPIREGMMVGCVVFYSYSARDFNARQERLNEVITQRRDDVDTFVDDDGVLSS